jgi:hypothetical protein
MTFRPFHVHLYGAGGGPMTSRFDDVATSLAAVERLYFEPDGSFVWAGPEWQIDGMIYDRDGVLQYADLKGHCPLPLWRQLTVWIAGSASDSSHPVATVWLPGGQILHDLQTFEEVHWQ